MTAKRRNPRLSEDQRLSMKLAGDWMRAVREGAGISQRQVPLPLKRSTVFMSEMEAGKARLTPLFYEVWAQAVGLEPRQVAQVMIGFHTPFLYEPLFGEPFDPDRVIAATPPPFDNLGVAEIIKRLRSEAGISPGAMAERLGVSMRVYVAYENGGRRVPVKQLEQIAQQFDVPLSALSNAEPTRPGRTDQARPPESRTRSRAPRPSPSSIPVGTDIGLPSG